MIIGGTFTIGALVAFLAYVSQFEERVAKLVDNLTKVRALKGHAERLGDIVLTEPELRASAEDEGRECSAEASIEISNLSFRYADEEPCVLRNVNLTIAPAECVAIIGRPKCGKTTLLDLILGILTPTEGDITIDGINPRSAGYEQVRSAMSAVMQEDFLFAGTIAENISVFDPDVDMARVEECAALAAIHEEIDDLAMRYDTSVGEMGIALSEGQKQRVLLARALYKRPQILVLDEATSHVDVERERQVSVTLGSLKMTRIIVAHSPEIVALADRCFLLQDAALTEVSRSVDAERGTPR